MGDGIYLSPVPCHHTHNIPPLTQYAVDWQRLLMLLKRRMNSADHFPSVKGLSRNIRFTALVLKGIGASALVEV